MSYSDTPLDTSRPFAEMRDTGLLWLINKAVFHHRGYALAFHVALDESGAEAVTGWSLDGDGTEAWVMGPGIDEDAMLARVRQLLGP